jgi:RNA polymerase sigma-70 factor (ECF subfamily)
MTRTSPDSLDAWIARIRPKLLRIAGRLLDDPAEAENLVQATLATVWEAHRRGERPNLDPYAKRAVWLNALRLRARRREWLSLEGDEWEEHEPALSVDEGELTGWELEQAIATLPPAQQAVIRLRFYGGLSFQEIGETLAISMNTAASRCRYALHSLREAFAPREAEETEDG